MDSFNLLFESFLILLSALVRLPQIKPFLFAHFVQGLINPLFVLLFSFLQGFDLFLHFTICTRQHSIQFGSLFLFPDFALELLFDLHVLFGLQADRQLACLVVLLVNKLINGHLSEEVEADQHALGARLG